jgi:hypothetical protein
MHTNTSQSEASRGAARRLPCSVGTPHAWSNDGRRREPLASSLAFLLTLLFFAHLLQLLLHGLDGLICRTFACLRARSYVQDLRNFMK